MIIILKLPPRKLESYMLRNVIALGLKRIFPLVLNVIIDLDNTVNVRMSINVILRRFYLNVGAVQKQKSITYSECVSGALITQYAKCIHRCYLKSSVTSLALRRFLIKDTIFEKLLRIEWCFEFLYSFRLKYFSF
jgi:hypothetical protein